MIEERTWVLLGVTSPEIDHWRCCMDFVGNFPEIDDRMHGNFETRQNPAAIAW